MDRINQELETENCALVGRLTATEAENHQLSLDNDALKKSLEKQKQLYRNFSYDVIESERLRSESFKTERKSILEQNKALVKENRQLNKDLLFYKAAYEELDKEYKSVPIGHLSQQSANFTGGLAGKNEQGNVRRSSRKEATPAPNNRSKQVTTQAGCKCQSSKKVLKVNEKLYIENKKHKLKISNLSSTVVFLKRKNNQLENWKNKMINNRMRSLQDINELNRLADSTELKNKDIYTPEILAKLDQLSK